MKKIMFALSMVAFFMFTYQADAMICKKTSGESVCITSKKDFYTKDITKFDYLDWSHSISQNAILQGKTGHLTIIGKYEKVNYSIPGDKTVNYTVNLFDLSDSATATAVFANYVTDNETKIYKQSKRDGTVYLIDANKLMWKHKNIIVMIHAASDAKTAKNFLTNAYNVYKKRIKPEYIANLNPSKIPAPVTASPTTKTNKKDISVDLKVNKSDDPRPVPFKAIVTLTWKASGAEKCESSGNYIQKKSKKGVWAQGDRSLPTKGSLDLIAGAYLDKTVTTVPSLFIEIICSNNIGTNNYSSARDSVTLQIR